MAALTAARAAQMVDTCTISRPTAPVQTPVLDADGNAPATPGAQVYDGPCLIGNARVQRGMRVSIKPNANDLDVALSIRGLKLPADAADLRPGDLVTVTASAFTPSLVGERLEVLREDMRTYSTYRSYELKGSSWLSPPPGPSAG